MDRTCHCSHEGTVPVTTSQGMHRKDMKVGGEGGIGHSKRTISESI